MFVINYRIFELKILKNQNAVLVNILNYKKQLWTYFKYIKETFSLNCISKKLSKIVKIVTNS